MEGATAGPGEAVLINAGCCAKLRGMNSPVIWIVGLVGVCFIIYGVYGIYKGEIRDRYLGHVVREERPVAFWFSVSLYIVLGVAALVIKPVVDFFK